VSCAFRSEYVAKSNHANRWLSRGRSGFTAEHTKMSWSVDVEKATNVGGARLIVGRSRHSSNGTLQSISSKWDKCRMFFNTHVD
jgi:hypothetical protein